MLKLCSCKWQHIPHHCHYRICLKYQLSKDYVRYVLGHLLQYVVAVRLLLIFNCTTVYKGHRLSFCKGHFSKHLKDLNEVVETHFSKHLFTVKQLFCLEKLMQLRSYNYKVL
jgi:hypothetical protein